MKFNELRSDGNLREEESCLMSINHHTFVEFHISFITVSTVLYSNSETFTKD